MLSESVTSIEPIDDSDDLIYTFKVEIDENPKSVDSSGIDTESVDIQPKSDTQFIKQGTANLISENTYEVKVRISAPAPEQISNSLDYIISAKDKAGNKGSKEASFQDAVDLVGDLTVAGASGSDYIGFNSTSSGAYSVLATTPLQDYLKALQFALFPSAPFVNGKVYYKRSGVPFVYGIAYTNIRRKSFSGSVPIRLTFVKRQGGQRYALPKISVPVNVTIPGSNMGLPTPVTWNPQTAGAGDGAYDVEASAVAWGVRTHLGPNTFKLSNAPCVKLSDWRGATPDQNLPIDRCAHILQHLITPNGVKGANDIFGHFDSYFRADFPSLVGAAGYDEDTDRNAGFPVAFTVLGRGALPPAPPPYWAGAANQFDGVLRIGSAVLAPGVGSFVPTAKGGLKRSARTAPVVLTNNVVIWVRSTIDTSNRILTIFPDNQSQNTYENSLE